MAFHQQYYATKYRDKMELKKMSVREVQLLQLDLIKKVDKFCNTHQINYYLIGGSCLGAVRHSGFIPWDDDIDIAMLRSDYDRFIEIIQDNPAFEEYFVQNYNSDKAMAPALTRLCIKNTFVDIKYSRHLKNQKYTYIDVFPLDKVPENKYCQELHRKHLYLIDRIIQLKLFHLYRGSKLEFIAKKTISSLLSIIPLNFLQKRRVAVMAKYKNSNSNLVCSTVSKYGYKKQVIDQNIYGRPQRLLFEDVTLCVPEKYEEYLTHLFGANYMSIPPEEARVKPQDIYRYV